MGASGTVSAVRMATNPVTRDSLSGPTHFGEIYEASVRNCVAAVEGCRTEVVLTFHLSPGTPAMAAVWVILAKTRFPAELIESSREHVPGRAQGDG